MNLQNLPNVIAACATMHYMYEIHKEHFNNEWYTNSDHNYLDSEVCLTSPGESSTTDASGP